MPLLFLVPHHLFREQQVCSITVKRSDRYIDVVLCRLSLDRSELDNLQKSRIQRYYGADFAIELEFEPLCCPERHSETQ